MRILLVHQYFLGASDAGGSRFNQFTRYWARRGHRVTVIAGMVHYATGRKRRGYRGRFIVVEQPAPRVRVLRCHVSESYNVSFLGRLWAYFSFVFSSIWAGLRAGRQDVIICTSPPLTVGVTGVVLSALKRIPLVFEVRDLWPETAIETGVLRNRTLIRLSYWLERLIYRRSSWVNVLTPAFYDALRDRKGVSEHKLSMIPNGADLDIISPGPHDNRVRHRHDIGSRFLVVYLGAHGLANHLAQLLEAARLLKGRDDIRFMLVGDGMEKPALKRLARQWGLSNVVFVDSVPKAEVSEYCAAADVCCAVLKKLDVFRTVYPNKIFDYMSAARPVIVAIDGIARQLVEQADAGIYAEPENARQIADAVLQLAGDRQRCRQMGENGLAFVRRYFDRRKLAADYERVLLGVVSRRPSTRNNTPVFRSRKLSNSHGGQ